MIRYGIELTRSAQRQLALVPKRDRLRVVGAIELLSVDPFPPKSVRLAGHESRRIRVGDYRVIYLVESERLVVLVVKVGHRRDVYHALK